MKAPKYALVSDLDQNRFHEDAGIGGFGQCVKIFDDRIAALLFAVEMIRKFTAADGAKLFSDDPETVLDDFQFCLGGLEYFHLFPVVE